MAHAAKINLCKSAVGHAFDEVKAQLESPFPPRWPRAPGQETSASRPHPRTIAVHARSKPSAQASTTSSGWANSGYDCEPIQIVESSAATAFG